MNEQPTTPGTIKEERVNPEGEIETKQEKLTPAGKRGIQGILTDAGSAEQSALNNQTEKSAAPEKGPALLTTETKMELNRIISLPVEQRREAMGKFLQGQQDRLGNTTQEGKSLQLDAEVLRGGKGIIIRDENGQVYQINYE